LIVRFEDGVERRICFEALLHGELYGPRQDRAVFDQVRLDPEVHTLVWPNGADFDPATLYDWPEQEGRFLALAQHWQRTRNPCNPWSPPSVSV
jgi:hypothetical protein